MVENKIVLYYFSSTGNTLAVARELAAKFDSQKTVEIISISKALKNEQFCCDAKTVGILFPVYAEGLPALVCRFVEKIQIDSSAYVFSVATFGGMVGFANLQLKKMLAKKGVDLQVGFGIKHVDNYVPFFSAPKSEKMDKIFNKVDLEVERIFKTISGKIAGSIKNSGLFNFLFQLIYKIAMMHFPKSDKSLRLSDKCNGCGICAKVCPVNDIVIKNSRPQWQGHCEHCLGCLHWCPQKAISFKKKLWQYHHPQVTLKDMFQD